MNLFIQKKGEKGISRLATSKFQPFRLNRLKIAKMETKMKSVDEIRKMVANFPKVTKEELLKNAENKDPAQAIRNAYDFFLEKATADNIRFSHAKFDPSFLEDFISFLPAGGNVLDIGCGYCREVKYFSDLNFNAYGVDISQRDLTLVEEVFPNLKLYCGDFRDFLKKPPVKFDGIYENLMLMYLPKKEIEEALPLILENLNPGGVFQASFEKNRGSDRTGWEMVPVSGEIRGIPGSCLAQAVYLSYFFPDELENTLVKAGFKIVKLFVGKQSGVAREVITVICRKKRRWISELFHFNSNL